MTIIYKQCKIGCDHGVVYTNRFGMQYPVQCVYCLEMAVQEKYPDIFTGLADVQKFTREELFDMLENGTGDYV